jgi:tryptophan-rich sensory protein
MSFPVSKRASTPDGPSKYRPLYFFLLLTLGVGALGSVAIKPNIATWYAGLAKPNFSPPNWLFAPAWTALYILMAVAAWRVWRLLPKLSQDNGRRRSPITIEMAAFGVQLACNCAWSFLFFSAHLIGAALIELSILLLLVLATLILFWRRDPWAGILLLPYLAWTGFALALNTALWRLNA